MECKRAHSNHLADYRWAHQATHLVISIGPNGPMNGLLQLGPVTKKGKIPYFAIPPHLPSLKTAPTHCLEADNLSSAVFPVAPLSSIPHPLPPGRQPLLCCPTHGSLVPYSINGHLFVLPQANPFTTHATGFHLIIAPHFGAPLLIEQAPHIDTTRMEEKQTHLRHFSEVGSQDSVLDRMWEEGKGRRKENF